MQFLHSGRIIVFELFFSPSQVSQDLRLLEQSTANVKIAVLLDQSIDSKLADEYFRKKPNAFPFLWLSDVLLLKREEICLARLKELIDETPLVDTLRRLLASPVGEHIEKQLGEYLTKVEAKINTNQQLRTVEQLSRQQILALMMLDQIIKLGVSAHRLKSLFAWLQDYDVLLHAVRLVKLGFQTFLITSLDGQHAIWTDGDLADYLFIGAERRRNADVVLCINTILKKARCGGQGRRTTISRVDGTNSPQHPGVRAEDFRPALQQVNSLLTQKARPSFEGQAGLGSIHSSSRPFPTIIIIRSFLIGVEQARHQGANHPEAGTTLQREADRKTVAIRACIGLIFGLSQRT